jgi:hypothetical protein
MANRNFNRLQAIDKEVKFLFLTAAIGSGGDPTLNESKSVGIKSISDTAPGEYDITLGVPGGDTDKYASLLYFQASLIQSTAVGTDGGISFQVETDDITNGIIKLFAIRDSGIVAEILSGATIKIMIAVKNSNQPGVGA